MLLLRRHVPSGDEETAAGCRWILLQEPQRRTACKRCVEPRKRSHGTGAYKRAQGRAARRSRRNRELCYVRTEVSRTSGGNVQFGRDVISKVVLLGRCGRVLRCASGLLRHIGL